jgi:hypothetical protein
MIICTATGVNKKIAASLNGNIAYEEFMDTSLAANYVPFRSSKWETLVNRKLALDFARSLWSDILSFVQPHVIICMAIETYNGFKAILKDRGFQLVCPEKGEFIGWGKVTYNFTELSDGNRTVILVRLPHLSTYKIFSRKECETEIDKIISNIASAINAF